MYIVVNKFDGLLGQCQDYWKKSISITS